MTFLYIVIALVIVFDFINGYHDSANSIATDPVVINLSVMGATISPGFLQYRFPELLTQSFMCFSTELNLH